MFFGHRKKHTHTHIRLARESQVSPKTFQLRASVLGTTLEMKFGGGLGLRCLPLQDDLDYPSSDNHGSGENGCISSNVGHTNSGLEMLRDDNLQASTAGAHKKHILMTGHQSHLQLMQKLLSILFVHLGTDYISLSIQSLCNRLGTKRY